MTGSASEPLVRHVDGDSEFVVDVGHMPMLITTWFGSPTLALAGTYAKWFEDFVERSRASGQRFVILDDAVRAARPAPAVRGRLSQITCSKDVVVDRVVVVGAAAIRGAITAISWSTGVPIKTAPAIDEGVRTCLELLDTARVARPREFKFRPAEPSLRR